MLLFLLIGGVTVAALAFERSLALWHVFVASAGRSQWGPSRWGSPIRQFAISTDRSTLPRLPAGVKRVDRDPLMSRLTNGSLIARWASQGSPGLRRSFSVLEGVRDATPWRAFCRTISTSRSSRVYGTRNSGV
jgi:hypothetical protein